MKLSHKFRWLKPVPETIKSFNDVMKSGTVKFKRLVIFIPNHQIKFVELILKHVPKTTQIIFLVNADINFEV